MHQHDGCPAPGPRHPPDPAERLQDRVDQFIQRLSLARDQADRLISAAERIFAPARPEPAHAGEPSPDEPGRAKPPDPVVLTVGRKRAIPVPSGPRAPGGLLLHPFGRPGFLNQD